MRNLIEKHTAGKKVLILFLGTNLIYALMLIVTIPNVMRFSGGLDLMDMLPTGYDADYVKNLLEALGKEGRRSYLYYQIPVDMIYPFLFAISYCLLLAYFLKKLGRIEGPLYYSCLLPLFAGLFDYLENTGIITMLLQYPDFSDTLVALTSMFTILKSGITTVYFLVLLIVMGMWIVSRLKLSKPEAGQ